MVIELKLDVEVSTLQLEDWWGIGQAVAGMSPDWSTSIHLDVDHHVTAICF